MPTLKHTALALALLGLTGCSDCQPSPAANDGGADAGPAPRSDAAVAPVDAGPRRDGGSGCNEDTPGYGDRCGQCGVQVCGNTGALTCADPGYNGCGVCGQLDMDGGILNRPCGTCGVVTCADGGLATQCTGEHEPNTCGGCAELSAAKGPPDASCSACGTGRWTCHVNQADMSCWGGLGLRDGGACAPTVLVHADMQDLTSGNYVRAGTRAVIQDVGADADLGTTDAAPLLLTFDPLVLGPGGAVLESAVVYLSPSDRHDDTGAYALPEFFAAYHLQDAGYPADPVRQYHLWFPLDGLQYVIVFDGFLGLELARGRLVAGAPPPP